MLTTAANSNYRGSVLVPMPAVGSCSGRVGAAFTFVADRFSPVDQTFQGIASASTVAAAGSCRLRWLRPGLMPTIELRHRYQTGFTSIIAARQTSLQQLTVLASTPIKISQHLRLVKLVLELTVRHLQRPVSFTSELAVQNRQGQLIAKLELEPAVRRCLHYWIIKFAVSSKSY